jgi:hypothetical protein
MKRYLFILVIVSVLFSALFFGCDFFSQPDTDKRAPSENTDSERKDELALKHMQITSISEETLASYVMDFIRITSGTGAERSVQPSPAVAITKTTKIMHTVETGFAETTADKRSARPVIGPGEIPFYVFTLENQQSGETGFALACGDSRIGSVLAVVTQGNYDDVDNPFMGIFYTGLYAYIENTIGIYNSITEADIENALNKNNEARNAGIYVPVTDVGKNNEFDLVGIKNDGVYNNDLYILETEWHQNEPYNNMVMKVFNPLTGYGYVTGCGPVAIAQVMAFHGKKRAVEGGVNPYPKSNVHKCPNVEYDWIKMIDKEDDNAVAVLMYEIGLPKNADSWYLFGAVATKRSGVISAFKEMGYQNPGSFKVYNFAQVKSSINAGCPVIADGSTTGINLLGITISTPIGGHYWVIDGYRRMAIKVKDKKVTGNTIDTNPLNYIHCNLGWRRNFYDEDTDKYVTKNGWYVSGVFDTHNIPLIDEKDSLRSATQDGLYQYGLGILTGITPIRK